MTALGRKLLQRYTEKGFLWNNARWIHWKQQKQQTQQIVASRGRWLGTTTTLPACVGTTTLFQGSDFRKDPQPGCVSAALTTYRSCWFLAVPVASLDGTYIFRQQQQHRCDIRMRFFTSSSSNKPLPKSTSIDSNNDTEEKSREDPGADTDSLGPSHPGKSSNDVLARNSKGNGGLPLSTTTSSSPPSHSDPPIWTWVDPYLPTYMQPYAKLARIDKPIGSMLLLWPCYWSIAVANATPGTLPDMSLLALFGVGAVVMRGAGCTINDMWDADLDRSVARTQSRPLAAGDVTLTQATAFLAAQLSVGLAVLLSLPHTAYCFYWGCASLPLVAMYPATKRFFPYPQAVLGLTFNWGAILGWAAVHGSIDWSVVAPLYGSGITWTIVYDTLYAHQDKKDDAKLQLQSTALTFGSDETRQRTILHGLAALTYAQWLVVGHAADLAWLPYALGATAAYSHLDWQVQTADFNNPHNLAERFRSNNLTGVILFAALTAGTFCATA